MRSLGRVAVLATTLRFDPRPLDPFALLRVAPIVRYVAAKAEPRCECSARRRRPPARR